jgi:hypothetical protein
MSRNSFKVRPVGFTQHFPETHKAGTNDIVGIASGFSL